LTAFTKSGFAGNAPAHDGARPPPIIVAAIAAVLAILPKVLMARFLIS
jgi:hypothetical protein